MTVVGGKWGGATCYCVPLYLQLVRRGATMYCLLYSGDLQWRPAFCSLFCFHASVRAPTLFATREVLDSFFREKTYSSGPHASFLAKTYSGGLFFFASCQYVAFYFFEIKRPKWPKRPARLSLAILATRLWLAPPMLRFTQPLSSALCAAADLCCSSSARRISIRLPR